MAILRVMAGSSEPMDLDGAVWLRREALADGITDREIARLCRGGVWHRVRRGAYTSGELWHRLGPEDRHRLLCRAVLRTAHPSSVLTHVSAAIECGVPVWDADLTQVHLTRTDGRAGRREAGVVHHRGLLLEEAVRVVNGVRVPRAARVAVEVCCVSDVEHALVTVNGLLHAEEMTREEFEAEAADARFWPHSLTTDLVHRLSDGRLESAAESRALHLIWRHHLPRPVPQLAIYDERGRLIGIVDFAWPEQGVFLEVDGRQKYSLFRREGESLEDFLMREKRREELICRVTGWVCVRITWADLATPELTARRIRRILESRAPRPA
jgi:hypothetical protein